MKTTTRRIVNVAFRLTTDETQTPRVKRCVLTEGYSDESDLPKILAIALPGYDTKPEHVEVFRVEEIRRDTVPATR